MKGYCWLAALFLLTACGHERLGVRNDYILPDDLASYHIGTPDPRFYCPPFGQRLTIQWSLSKDFKCYQNIQLKAKILFCNHETEEFEMAITTVAGSYIYEVLNEKYCTTGGILTYKIELMGDGELIDEWRNLLWTEIIQLNKDT